MMSSQDSFGKKLQIYIWVFFVLVIVLNVVLWERLYTLDTQELLSVSFLDVGQGDAVYIRAPNGNDLLVDTGPGRGVLRELGGVMPLSDKTISVVLLTHPDADHIGGFVPVSSLYTINTVIESGNKKDTTLSKEVDSVIFQKSIQSIVGSRGTEIILDAKNKVVFRILYPYGDVSSWEANDASIVGVLSYGDTRFLLTGDAPAESENFVALHDLEMISGAVLKIGHHGSSTSSSFSFLESLKPPIGIVSAGKNNRYGHPSDEVLMKLGILGIPTRSTAEEGTITFYINGKDVQTQ